MKKHKPITKNKTSFEFQQGMMAYQTLDKNMYVQVCLIFPSLEAEIPSVTPPTLVWI